MLVRHGLKRRVRFDRSGISRSIRWDGTIVNHSPPGILQKPGNASSGIGLVADDPVARAHSAAEFLKSRGFEAQVAFICIGPIWLRSAGLRSLRLAGARQKPEGHRRP